MGNAGESAKFSDRENKPEQAAEQHSDGGGEKRGPPPAREVS